VGPPIFIELLPAPKPLEILKTLEIPKTPENNQKPHSKRPNPKTCQEYQPKLPTESIPGEVGPPIFIELLPAPKPLKTLGWPMAQNGSEIRYFACRITQSV
jgi:hypothetical protein